ncbi:hypothetical protein [Streptomyces sp. NPDC093089]|uniref:hypothetical protein n=1 Tax=Streptomyces sp. NPDC093089 TaxID=3366024 RepID=UPI00381AE45F
MRGDAHLPAHEELAAGAREMLGARELDRRRGELHAWADEWRRRGWPASSPAYLLHGYAPMLRESGDVDRMLACALDEARHDRLRAVGRVCRALLAAGRADEAERVLRGTAQEHRELGPSSSSTVRGRCARRGTRSAAELLLSVARDLVEAGELGRAEAVLTGLHPLGHGCASAYAQLARAHADPVRARRCAALALHPGSWAGVLGAVLHADAGTLPLVLAEADRLLDAAVDRWPGPAGQADVVRSAARTSSANGSPAV